MAATASELAGRPRSGMIDPERLLDEVRPVAFAIAYQMLGSVSDSKSVARLCEEHGWSARSYRLAMTVLVHPPRCDTRAEATRRIASGMRAD